MHAMRRIWALADTHLSFARPKPMDVFGEHWRDHPVKIAAACRAVIAPDDLLLMPGDLSWALKRAEAEPDLAWLASLPGVKILAKGNHDFWWDSDRALNHPGLHDTPFVSDDKQIGVAGTRGWVLPDGEMAAADRAQCEKITGREVQRLTRRLEAIRGCRYKFALIHYPPLDVFAPVLKAHGVETVLYGHLHRNGSDPPLPEQWHGLRALCVACDRLHFRPRLVATV